MPRHVGPFPERFWAQVDRRSPDECWPWLGTLMPQGYGQFNHRGTTESASRVAFELTFGPLGPGLMACHNCDNRPCCNPAHLFSGTARDNARDMVTKGRARNGGLKGEAHPAHKLTEAQVATIRLRLGSGLRHRDIASEFGVSHATIDHISTGRKWAHGYPPHPDDAVPE